MKIFLNLFLVAVLFLIPVSVRADDTAMPPMEIPEEEMQILKDNATALKDTVSETKAYLENGLGKWTWVKDTFGNDKYPEILELINTVDKHGFSKHMGNAIVTLSGYENGIKKITDTHADFKAMETFYDRYKPDKNNPLRSLEQISHVLEDLNNAIEKFDPSGGVLTRPFREMIQYFQESADAFHGALGRIRKIIKQRGGGGIGLGFTADTDKGKAFKKKFPNQTAYRYQWLKLKQDGSNTDEAEIWDDGSGNAFVWWKNKWIKIKPGIAGITFVYKGHHLAFGKIPQINYFISRCNTGWDKVLQARKDAKNYFKVLYSDSECVSKILAYKKITLENNPEETFIARYVFRRDIRKKIDSAVHLINNSLLVEGKVIQAQTSDKSIANVPIAARFSGSTARTTSESGGWFTLLINTKPSFENRRNVQVTINVSGYEPYNEDWPIRQQCSSWYSINLKPTSAPDSENAQNNPPAPEDQPEALCNEADTAVAAFLNRRQVLEQEIKSLEEKIVIFSNRSQELNKDAQAIKTGHKTTENKAVKMTEIAHELEKTALEVCETTNGLNDHTITDSEHNRNYNWIIGNKERLKSFLDSSKHFLEEAAQVKEENKNQIDAVKRLKDKLQTNSRKLEQGVLSLQRKNLDSQKKLNELRQKIKMLGGLNCSERLLNAMDGATNRNRNYQAKLKQVTALYVTAKTDFTEKSKMIENMENLYNKTAYLIDLSKVYVERAKDAAVKGAFCIVLADGIMERVFIPDVRGLEIGKAEPRLKRKGLSVSSVKLGPAPSENETGVVTKLTPGITKRVKKGTVVTLSHYDMGLDKESLIANTNCTQWPGSQPVWDNQTDQAVCDCIGGMVWNQDKTKCISTAQAALDTIDCSHYPGTTPGYDNNGNPMCLCPGGLPWLRGPNRCATKQDIAMASIDCSGLPGTVPVWDSQNNRAACDCPVGTEWNSQMGKCINQEDLAVANADCSHLPGSAPVWNYINNRVECKCQSPYSRDPMTGKCVDLVEKLAQEQRDFDKQMENNRRRNEEQQQLFNNIMSAITGLSQPDRSGNSNPQNQNSQGSNSTHNTNRQENQNQGSSSISKNPAYCGIWKVRRTCTSETNLNNKKEWLGTTYTRNWRLYPYNGGKTIEISEYLEGGNTFVEFKKPGSSGSNFSTTHTSERDGGRILRKSTIILSVTKNSFTGTWTIDYFYKSSGKRKNSRTYSMKGISKIRSYN